MNAIKNNPYRVLGLFGNSSERELQKRISIIKRYQEVGKPVKFENDFSIFGEVHRDSESVQSSSSKIEHVLNKVYYSLFWFINGSDIDDIAFNNLRDGNIEKAEEIWHKTIKDQSVNDKNYTWIHNLSTLNMLIYFCKDDSESEKMQRALQLKTELINSDIFSDYVSKICGNSLTVENKKIITKFIESILSYFQKKSTRKNKTKMLVDLFSDCSNDIQDYVIETLTGEPFNNIETAIEKTKARRVDCPADSIAYGEELYDLTHNDLKILKDTLGEKNVKYTLICNKVADEIIQCSIDYHNEYNGSYEINPCEDSLRVLKLAKKVNPSGETKRRLEENLKIIKGNIENEVTWEKEKRVKDEIKFLIEKVEWYENLTTIDDILYNGKDFIRMCKSYLEAMEEVLGKYDDTYLTYSSAIVVCVQNKLINVINYLVSKTHGMPSAHQITEMRSAINISCDIIKLMSHFDMNDKMKDSFNKNKKDFYNFKNKLSPHSNTSGCYIATMAYGDYDHPQVIKLRHYRDNTLQKTALGRLFIRVYYKYSPTLVKVLKDKSFVNKTIRKILDGLVRVI